MVLIDLLEGSDGEYFIVEVGGEKYDRRIEQLVDLKGVGVLWRARGTTEVQMSPDKAPHTVIEGVGCADFKCVHEWPILP
jgi:hypothetical protein